MVRFSLHGDAWIGIQWPLSFNDGYKLICTFVGVVVAQYGVFNEFTGGNVRWVEGKASFPLLLDTGNVQRSRIERRKIRRIRAPHAQYCCGGALIRKYPITVITRGGREKRIARIPHSCEHFFFFFSSKLFFRLWAKWFVDSSTSVLRGRSFFLSILFAWGIVIGLVIFFPADKVAMSNRHIMNIMIYNYSWLNFVRARL